MLSPLALIIGLRYFYGFQILIPAGTEKQMLISVMIGMTVNLSLNFILIRHYKQNGATVANVISELFVTLSSMYFCFKIIPVRRSHKPLLFSFLAACPLVIIVFSRREVNLNDYFVLGLGAVLFAMLYLIIHIKVFKNSVVNHLINDYLISLSQVCTKEIFP